MQTIYATNKLTNDSLSQNNSTGFSLSLSYEFNGTTTIMENEDKTVIQTNTRGAVTFEMSTPTLEAERNMWRRAVNNRTRERNYANICLQLAEGQITDQEFEEEIMRNEDRYVISFSDDTSTEEIQIAAHLANEVLDVESEEDFRELFSISSASLTNLTNSIENE